MTAAEPSTEGTYRDRIAAVEPGGNEYIAEADRHGKPSQLLWTWASPNLEFATIFVGVLAVAYYGMTFWQAVAGIVLGTGLGAIAHYFLSARGPLHGVPQMVLGRLPFGFKGNVVPAALMSITAGVGWFATNSVSGAFALSTLFHIGPLLALVLIVVVQTGLAFFGHNLVQAFERWAFPVLAVIFAITSVVILSKSHVGRTGGRGRRRRHGRIPADRGHRVRLRGGGALRGRLHPLPSRVDGWVGDGFSLPPRACSCPASSWRPSVRLGDHRGVGSVRTTRPRRSRPILAAHGWRS